MLSQIVHENHNKKLTFSPQDELYRSVRCRMWMQLIAYLTWNCIALSIEVRGAKTVDLDVAAVLVTHTAEVIFTRPYLCSRYVNTEQWLDHHWNHHHDFNASWQNIKTTCRLEQNDAQKNVLQHNCVKNAYR